MVMARQSLPPPDGRPRRTVPTRKNRPADSAFIEEHAAEFSFTDNNQLVWTGLSSDWGSGYQKPPDEDRCLAERDVKDEEGQQVLDRNKTPLRARCFRWRMRGAALCVECAGGSERVKREVRERLLGSADALVGRLLDIALGEGVQHNDALKAISTALDRMGMRGGIEVSPDVPGWQKVWEALQGGDVSDDDA